MNKLCATVSKTEHPHLAVEPLAVKAMLMLNLTVMTWCCYSNAMVLDITLLEEKLK